MTEAERICQGVDGPMHDQAVELTENVIFMARKLRETRENLGDYPLVVKYDNGGGQKGVRENPVFKAYTNLFRQYANGLARLRDMIGTDAAEDAAGEEETPLAQILRLAANE